MKNSLFTIEEEYIGLMQQIEEAEGEITDEVLDQLAINEAERSSKSIAYLSVIKSKESYINQIDEEINRLQALKKTTTNIITRLKTSLLDAVKIFGTFEVGLSTFGTRKSTKLEILDNEKIDKKYFNVKVTETVDKKLITQAIKNGEFIDGAELVECLNLKIN